jgi:ferritin-like metal-binding protein YciE
MATKIENLEDLFRLKITSLYDIESAIVGALPKMAKAATGPELKEALEMHLEETRSQVTRLEEIFTMLEMKPKKTKVEAIRGLIADADWIIKQKPSPGLLDALIVASARYVEHYEMAGYMSAIAWAEHLGMTEATELLRATLEEENNAETKLSGIAETTLENAETDKASEDESEDEDEEEEDE